MDNKSKLTPTPPRRLQRQDSNVKPKFEAGKHQVKIKAVRHPVEETRNIRIQVLNVPVLADLLATSIMDGIVQAVEDEDDIEIDSTDIRSALSFGFAYSASLLGQSDFCKSISSVETAYPEPFTDIVGTFTHCLDSRSVPHQIVNPEDTAVVYAMDALQAKMPTPVPGEHFVKAAYDLRPFPAENPAYYVPKELLDKNRIKDHHSFIRNLLKDDKRARPTLELIKERGTTPMDIMDIVQRANKDGDIDGVQLKKVIVHLRNVYGLEAYAPLAYFSSGYSISLDAIGLFIMDLNRIKDGLLTSTLKQIKMVNRHLKLLVNIVQLKEHFEHRGSSICVNVNKNIALSESIPDQEAIGYSFMCGYSSIVANRIVVHEIQDSLSTVANAWFNSYLIKKD